MGCTLLLLRRSKEIPFAFQGRELTQDQGAGIVMSTQSLVLQKVTFKLKKLLLTRCSRWVGTRGGTTSARRSTRRAPPPAVRPPSTSCVRPASIYSGHLLLLVVLFRCFEGQLSGCFFLLDVGHLELLTILRIYKNIEDEVSARPSLTSSANSWHYLGLEWKWVYTHICEALESMEMASVCARLHFGNHSLRPILCPWGHEAMRNPHMRLWGSILYLSYMRIWGYEDIRVWGYSCDAGGAGNGARIWKCWKLRKPGLGTGERVGKEHWEESESFSAGKDQPQALDSSLASLINDMWGKLIESRHTGPFQIICKIIFINILNVKDRGADK